MRHAVTKKLERLVNTFPKGVNKKGNLTDYAGIWTLFADPIFYADNR